MLLELVYLSCYTACFCHIRLIRQSLIRSVIALIELHLTYLSDDRLEVSLREEVTLFATHDYNGPLRGDLN